MSKTACIILNYKGPRKALGLIDSLEKTLWKNKIIFAVENGSGDDSKTLLTERLGEEQVITTPINLGFAGGMNLGLKRALESDAEFFWLLSKDLTVEPDCLNHLHSLWPRLLKPGMLGSLTDLNATEQIYFCQAKIDRHGRTRHKGEDSLISELPELKAEFGETDYVNGSCIFTHRSVIEKIGLIPEDYFLYFEDSDWGLRAQRSGYKNYVSFRSRVHHHRDSSAFSATAQYYCRRNSFIFRQKNGFTRPWSKATELLRLRKTALRAWIRGDRRMSEVLRAVIQDIRDEKTGLGPWR